MEIDKAEMIQKQIEAIKQVVRQTFEQIDALEKIKSEAQEKIKILRHDIFDLKDGRLDRIVERQSMDAKIKEISILDITKSGGGANPWYVEYEMTYAIDGTVIMVVVNNSVAKMHSSGTYKIGNGTIKYL